MNGHADFRFWGSWSPVILCSRSTRSSEADREASVHIGAPQRTGHFAEELFFGCQDLHRICTTLPHVFHRRAFRPSGRPGCTMHTSGPC
jgi:hypothetical protein